GQPMGTPGAGMDPSVGRVLRVAWGLSVPGDEVNDRVGDDRMGRSPGGPRAVILTRLLVGLVFFEEGIQKFLFPAVMGTGRFARIGIPAPEVMGPFVGGVEIVCGALLVLGLLTRLATVPLLVYITVAILAPNLHVVL